MDLAKITDDSGKPWDWYIKVVKNYVGFEGRARRKEYWMFQLFNFIIAIVLGVIGAIIHTSILSNIYALAVLLPGIAAAIRRMHDTDRSGWWILVPIANVVFLCLDSQPGTNRFGPNPKGVA